jgi:hypothetical protein
MEAAQASDAAGTSQQTAKPNMLSVAKEGVTAGLLGAAAVAIWFLIADALTGQPFRTPASLGARFFRGAAAETLAALPESVVVLVAGYTIVHGLAFVGAGLMIAYAMHLFERTPPLMIPGFFFLVVFFEFVYYTYVLALVEPVLGAVNWFAVLAGNLIAVASMVGYFWIQHPSLLKRLLRG